MRVFSTLWWMNQCLTLWRHHQSHAWHQVSNTRLIVSNRKDYRWYKLKDVYYSLEIKRSTLVDSKYEGIDLFVENSVNTILLSQRILMSEVWLKNIQRFETFSDTLCVFVIVLWASGYMFDEEWSRKHKHKWK